MATTPALILDLDTGLHREVRPGDQLTDGDGNIITGVISAGFDVKDDDVDVGTFSILNFSGVTVVDEGGGQVKVIVSAVTDHAALTGLLVDDHTQYANLNGRSGGQDLAGSTLATEGLTLRANTAALDGTVDIPTTTASTSPVTGALVVAGGVGIGDDLFVSGDVDIGGKLTVVGLIDPTGLQLETQASNPGDANTLWIRTSDGALMKGAAVGSTTDHGGLLGLSDDDHAQYAFLAGRAGGQTLVGSSLTAENLTLRANAAALNGTVAITTTTASSNAATGALTVAGGLGVAAALNVGGAVDIENTTASVSPSTGALVVDGGVGIAGDLFVGGSIDLPETLIFTEVASVPGGAPAAGDGKLWVRNDGPNVLVFTDDSGVDTVFGAGGVSSVFTRSGAVVAVAGDYTATQVTFAPDGDIAAVTTQAAIVEVRDDTDTKLSGKASTSHTHTLVDVTDSGALAALDTVGTPEIDASAVTLAKIQDIATDSFLGRDTAATGVVEVLTATQVRTIINVADGAVAEGATGDTHAAIVTGNPHALDATDVGAAAASHTHTLVDVTDSGALAALDTVSATEIDDEAVTLAKMQHIATDSFLGRTTAATGDVEVLTGTQATVLLDDFTSGLSGLAPASGGGTTNFLRADGTWTAPGSGDSLPVPDTTSLVEGSVDATKEVRFEVDGLTTGTIRTITMPDADITLDDNTDSRPPSGSASGDLTGTYPGPTIATSAVTLAKMADIATASFLGRTTAATGVVEVLTGTQATALLDDFTSGLSGLAPSSGGGTANFLRADGTWAVPPGTGGSLPATDDTIIVQDNVDGTKQMRFEASGIPTSTTIVLTLPAASVTLDGVGDSRPPTSHTHTLVDVTDSGALAALDTVGSTEIDASAVTLAKIQNIATARILGRVTAATGVVEELTGTQATTLLDDFTSALSGLAPASGGGTANFLRADGTWAVPPGTGGSLPATDDTIIVQDNVDNTKQMRFEASGIPTSTTIVLTLPAASVTLDGTGDSRPPTSHTHTLVDVTDSGALAALDTVGTSEIDDEAVTLAKMQHIATASFLGRNTAATGDVEVLTGTVATTLLDTFTTSLQGVAPASGGGTTNFLRADGTWAAPAGGASDHGALTGLTDDDHSQYLHLSGRTDGQTIIPTTNKTPQMTALTVEVVGSADFMAGSTGFGVVMDARGMNATEFITATSVTLQMDTTSPIRYGTVYGASGQNARIPYGMLFPGSMGVLEQQALSATSFSTAFKENGGFTDITTAVNSAGTDVTLFDSDGDFVYLGSTSQFNAISVKLATAASEDIGSTFSFSNGSGGWIGFNPIDTTQGFQYDGVVTWREAGELTGWLTDTVNAVSGRYWLRIARNNANAITVPTEDILFAFPTSSIYNLHSWDHDGNLNIRSVSVGDDGASSPAYSFRGDATTGLFWDSSNSAIGFSVSGAQVGYWNGTALDLTSTSGLRTVYINDADGNNAIWLGTSGLTDRQLFDTSSGLVVDWQDGELYSFGTKVVDWSNGGQVLYDSASIQSVNWTNRTLSDSGSTDSLDYGNRTLLDSGGSTKVDWDSTDGFYITGSTGLAMDQISSPGLPGTASGGILYFDFSTGDLRVQFAGGSDVQVVAFS